ncbi:MAG: hypothetical protein IID63_03200 [candidate division Zixibacteria bacterium]|nr:hypothetical protein [candidate division Zixibacteria bacterium]
MSGIRQRQQDDEDRRATDSFLFKAGSKFFLSTFVIIIFLTLVQCSIKKPEAPTWDTSLVIPVINRTYDMAELIRKLNQDGIEMDSAGNIFFTITQELDTVTISADYLNTPTISYSFSKTLDTFSIVTPNLAPVYTTLATITGISAVTVEDTFTIGAQSFNVLDNLPLITSYSSATIASGLINIYVHNNLGADLDTVIFEFWDVGSNSLLGIDSVFSGIPTGSSTTIPIDLAGKTITNRFQIKAQCHTVGGFVDSASTRGISTELDFVGALVVSGATAEIPSFSRSISSQVDLLESDRIDTANIAGGTLSLTITNSTPLDITIDIAFPDILSGSSPLTISTAILPLSTSNINIDLSGYNIAPTDNTVPQQLNVDATATIQPTAPTKVTVNQNDSFAISVDISGLSFNYVVGFFDSVEVSFAGLTSQINVPTGFDSIQFSAAVLTLEIENGIDLPGNLNIQIDGDNGNSLNLTGSISASGGLSSAISTIIEPSAGSFLSPTPSQIDVSGSIVFAQGGYQGRVEANDFITATVTFVAPLEIVIQPSTIETDIERTEIDTSSIGIITEHVREARFIYNIISHLPLGAQIDIYFGPDSSTLFANPQLLINAITLPAAPVDISGIVTDTISTDYQEIYLDSTDIKILENDTLFIGSRLNLSGTGGQSVKITANDYLSITGRVEVIYKFNGEF